MKKNHYEVLDIPRDAERETIKQATQLKINQIKKIYAVLGDPQKRKAYDAQLRTTQNTPDPVATPKPFSPPQHVKVLAESEKKSSSIQSIALRNIIHSGAHWFYWIALLSLVNVVMLYSEKYAHIIIGLGITQLTEKVDHQWIESFEYTSIVLDVIIAGIFILFGFFAAKGQKWAFILGLLIYIGDGALLWFVPAQPNLLSIGFHLFVLFWIYHGLQACFVDSSLSSPN